MLNRLTYPSIALPKQASWLVDFLLICCGSILISLCAHLAIPLPFTPVPLALAPHMCFALGATLGSRRGTLAVLMYIAQGLVGLPVFAGGLSGLTVLLGPRGGYLVGYVAGTYLIGYLIERMHAKTTANTFLALAAGNAILFFFGALQLAFFVGFPAAIWLGIVPFILGDLWKILMVQAGLKFLSTTANVHDRRL